MQSQENVGSRKSDHYQQKSNELQTSFQNLKDCVEGLRPIESFNELFYKFVRHNPEKEKIKIIAKEVRHRLMQSTKLKQVVDSFIVISKLLKLWTEGRSTDSREDLFQSKMKVIEVRLNKNEIGEYLQKVFEFFKREWQFRTHFQRLLDQKRQFEEGLKTMKQQRDGFKRVVFRVGSGLFSHFQLEENGDSVSMEERIMKEIGCLKQCGTIKPRGQEGAEQLVRSLATLKDKYRLDGSTSMGILASLEGAYQGLVKKNEEISKPLEDKSSVSDFSQLKRQNIQLKKQILACIKSQRELKEMLRQQKQITAISQSTQSERFNLTGLFFNSQFINQANRNYTRFLLEKIESLVEMKPKNAKMLFSSRQNSQTNFHQYFDNLPNILLVARLKNGSILGGFTHEQFRPKCTGEKGFLFNLTKMQIYERMQKSTIAYGDYYLIFGNSEISIKSNDMRLYSNFGAANRHFNCKDRNVEFFLGEGSSREVAMEIYEIHQISFD